MKLKTVIDYLFFALCAVFAINMMVTIIILAGKSMENAELLSVPMTFGLLAVVVGLIRKKI